MPGGLRAVGGRGYSRAVPVRYSAPARDSAEDRVARIVLDRADAGNALDLGTARELSDAVRRGLGNPYADALVITATGPDFCVGSDITAAQAAEDPTSATFDLAAALDDLFTTLNSSRKPVLVGMHGLAAGSGLGLALAGDLTFSTGDATFAVPPRGGSGAPDPGLAWLLPRGIGQQRALSFALSRRTLDAATAEDWGMVTVADDVTAAIKEAVGWLGGENVWSSSETRRLLRTSWETSRAELSHSEAATMVRAVLNRSRA